MDGFKMEQYINSSMFSKDPSASQVNTALCRNQINWVFKFIIMVGS
jgi:hypothetical protein